MDLGGEGSKGRELGGMEGGKTGLDVWYERHN